VLHLFDELVRSLFSALKGGPLSFYLLERRIDHHLYRPYAFLITRVYIDVKCEVSQGHQLEHFVLYLSELHNSFPMLALGSFLHNFTNLRGDRFALEDKNSEALQH